MNPSRDPAYQKRHRVEVSMLYLQLLAFLPLAAAGMIVARRLGRFWYIGFSIPFAILLLVILGHRIPRAAFIPPVSWTIDPDIAPLLMTPVIAVLFATLLPKLPRPRRVAVRIVTGVMLLHYGLLPALLPLVARPALAGTPTRLDRQGVCWQTHPYSCGPAAAVTCLARLGISAQEGPLAIAARCGPLVGTEGRLLAQAVSQLWPQALCSYQYITSLDQLSTPAVVNMVMPIIGGHYVAVLEVRPDEVIVGDPLSGMGRIPRAEFESEWTGAVVLFHRVPTETAAPPAAVSSPLFNDSKRSTWRCVSDDHA